jgi:hypothetical protein
MNRRTILKGGIVLAVTGHTAVASDETSPAAVSIDDFLDSATPAERARYHANGLMEAMAEMHPDRSWRSEICHKHRFVLTVGDPKIRKSARVAKVHVDDGPLLADDVTGTTAFADWEAGR